MLQILPLLLWFTLFGSLADTQNPREHVEQTQQVMMCGDGTPVPPPNN